MKKIVLLCAGNHFPKGAFAFLRQMNASAPVFVTGAFFYSMRYAQLLSAAFHSDLAPLIARTAADEDGVRQSVARFHQDCTQSGIEYSVHEESPLWDQTELVQETRFADLLVAGSDLFPDTGNRHASGTLKKALHDSECPILLVPENYAGVQRLLIAYDGKKQSMYAMKQFCGLFPWLSAVETEIVYTRKEERDDIPLMAYLEEYACRHFSSLTFTRLHQSRKKFAELMEQEPENTLLIGGAFGRSFFSTLYRSGFFTKIIDRQKLMVFVAHPVE